MSASLADRKWLVLGQDGANDPPACHPILGSKARYSRHSVFSGCGMIGSTMRESRCGS
jgi:hypothetical protein